MKHRDEKLDLVRGLSALVVLLAHTRGVLLCDMDQVVHLNVIIKLFYFLTGIHHQAVMVFFVLSGYFVGGSVMQTMTGKGFSAPRYGLARISRLWTVLLPAMALTLCADRIGYAVNPAAYHGSLLPLFSSGPTHEAPAVWDVPTFLGNLFFVQTIVTPCFGSNGPLWSLANEFWYYLLFPVAACGIRDLIGRRWLRGAFLLATFACIACILPIRIVAFGTVWLCGVAVWSVSRMPKLTRLFRGFWWRIIFGLLFAASLAASKTSSVLGNDYMVGLTFALWMPTLLGPWNAHFMSTTHFQGWHARLHQSLQLASTTLSEVSYTLYVVHFPLIFLAGTAWFGGVQFQPDAYGLANFALVTSAAMTLSAIMWFCFEHRTDAVRKRLVALWFKPTTTAK
ncbi:MAG: acyltransferase [Verrucomicrobiota bacterium]